MLECAGGARNALRNTACCRVIRRRSATRHNATFSVEAAHARVVQGWQQQRGRWHRDQARAIGKARLGCGRPHEPAVRKSSASRRPRRCVIATVPTLLCCLDHDMPR